MNAGTGVFVLTEANALVPMQAASFASEDDFQKLLASFPALLAGDQMDSANPRRFMLVDREQPIACEPGGAGRWSLDHLFLDQDGVPTLVEVKRGTDTRIRREVVGQMLDYAANAILHWPAEELRGRFEVRCEEAGKSAADVLRDELGVDPDSDGFWAKVKSNLQAGRIRMLFVADRIPAELRKVVEFMNVQMRPAEVLAVELRQYQGGGLRTLAPIVLGQTQEAIEQKAGANAKPRRLWDEVQILDAIAARDDAALTATAKALIGWMSAKADRVLLNDAPNVGSIAPEFRVGAEPCAVMRLWTDCSAAINFNQLMRTPAFSAGSARHELMDKMNAIPAVTIRPDMLEKQTFFRLASLTPDQGASFLEIMDWVAEKLRATPVEKSA
jgi:hypothetical protein